MLFCRTWTKQKKKGDIELHCTKLNVSLNIQLVGRTAKHWCQVKLGTEQKKHFNWPLSSCCRLWRGVSGLLLWEKWSPQIHLRRTAEIGWMVSIWWSKGFLLYYSHKCSLLTKLHANVLIRVLLPQFLITVCVTHEGKNHILNDALRKGENSFTSESDKNMLNFTYQIKVHDMLIFCFLLLNPGRFLKYVDYLSNSQT